MFLSGVLFVMFLAGCWLYCLTDAALVPASQFTGIRKSVWLTVIGLTFIFGAIAWVIARSRRRSRRLRLTLAGQYALADYDAPGIMWYPERPTAADVAFARHPATRAWRAEGPGRSAPVGPDDDPEFLRMLDRLISGTSDSGELSIILTVLLHKAGWRHGDRSDLRRWPHGGNHSSSRRNHWRRRPNGRAGRGRPDNSPDPGLWA